MQDMQKTNPADVEAERENIEEELHISGADTSTGLPEDKTTQEVRQGHTGDHVRYILAASIFAIAVAFAIIYWFSVR